MASSDEEFEPSQRFDDERLDIVTARSLSARKATTGATHRITKLYARGGPLDSQTTDSQFEVSTRRQDITSRDDTSIPSTVTLYAAHEDNQPEVISRRVMSSEAQLRVKPCGLPSPARSTPRSPTYEPAAPDSWHVKEGGTQLALAHVEIDMLRNQVKSLEAIRRLQDERISELQTELFDATHMLDPSEESQVLVEIPWRASKRLAAEEYLPASSRATIASGAGSEPAARSKKQRRM
ncbi:hypothetical protein OH77DRAFT_1417100 [Trametes cingulata]|nr:hypothetical protein OH77DRAFT_1417100 [Trametes cingulata]